MNNSRRNFLGIMAILTSGTVLAGSPLCLLEDKKLPGHCTLKNDWEKFMAAREARPAWPLATLQTNITAMPGMKYEQGQCIYLPEENLLALPTWIYWGNSEAPNDVLVSFFDNDNPQKKLKNINRFELAALAKLSVQPNEQLLLRSFCSKDHQQKKNIHVFRTSIKKQQQHQYVELRQGNHIVLKEPLFYNV